MPSARNTAEAARVLGDDDAYRRYSSLCERIRSAFHACFYDAEAKSYGDFGSNIFALYMGVPDKCHADVCASLREEIAVKYAGPVQSK